MEPSPLDNAVWHSLTTAPRRVRRASSGSRPTVPARRLGVRRPSSDFDDARRVARPAALVGRGRLAVLFRPELPRATAGLDPARRGRRPPDGAARARHRSTLPDARPLGPDDVGEMLALVELTRPGPFSVAHRRARRLRRRVRRRPARRHGRANASRLPGFREISAVCTHPDIRGRGLAAGLTALVARRHPRSRRAAVPPPRVRQPPGAPGLRGARLRVPAGGRVRRVRRSLDTVEPRRPPPGPGTTAVVTRRLAGTSDALASPRSASKSVGRSPRPRPPPRRGRRSPSPKPATLDGRLRTAGSVLLVSASQAARSRSVSMSVSDE